MPLEIEEWEQFIQEAEQVAQSYEDNEQPIARLKTQTDVQTPYQQCVLVVSFLDEEGNPVRYTEQQQMIMVPSGVTGEYGRQGAEQDEQQYVETIEARRNELIQHLENAGFQVREGVWT